MNRDEWVEIARRRILRILRTRRLASPHQLETKIAEAGPSYMRVNPHHISTALTSLRADGLVNLAHEVLTTKLYAPRDWDPTSKTDSERLTRIETGYRDYLDVQRKDRGRSLERITQKAIEETNQFHWYNRPGRPPPNGTIVSGSLLTGSGNLDHYLSHKGSQGLLIGIDDKNLRDWVYPHRPEIRTLLKKCLAYNMLPVLVARKVHFTTRNVFHHLGALAFETHFQFFDPIYEEQLTDVKHKDGVGFADIRYYEHPPPHLVKMFSSTLVNLLPHSWQTFSNNAQLIREYTEEEIDYHDLLVRLGLAEEFEEEDQEYEEPDDYYP